MRHAVTVILEAEEKLKMHLMMMDMICESATEFHALSGSIFIALVDRSLRGHCPLVLKGSRSDAVCHCRPPLRSHVSMGHCNGGQKISSAR